MHVYEFEGLIPVVHPEAYIHPTAVLIGDCIIERGCYIGPCAVIRGDLARITVHEGSNLQDSCVIHSFPGGEVVLEPESHIGHGAVVHGCRIGRNALVGINSVIMDRAVIGEESIVAAMAFVKAEMQVPPRSLVMGVPATVARQLRDDEIAWKSEGTRHYQQMVKRYLATARPAQPLREIEAGRPRLSDEGPSPSPSPSPRR
jgi:phenylacetic acid degradation protein